MATVSKTISAGTSIEVYRDDRNPVHPVKKGTITLVHRYVVGTDFASGDNLQLTLRGAKKILFAVAKTPSNTFLTLTEGGTAPLLTLTTGAATTDVEIMVVYTV